MNFKIQEIIVIQLLFFLFYRILCLTNYNIVLYIYKSKVRLYFIKNLFVRPSK